MGVTELDRLRETVRARRSLPAPDECRRIRVRAGLTQEELAPAVPVAVKTLARWERGERRPRGVNAERYAGVLAAIRDAREGA